MSTIPAHVVPEQSAPAAGGVFQALVADIVSGKYQSGTRLPAERELARQLGASRPTLREALRRMSEWGLIEARRGSGVMVCDPRYWTLEVLPSFLMHTQFGKDIPGMARSITDMLEMRAAVLGNLVAQIADRVTLDGLAEARATVRAAWDNRQNVVAFARLDFTIYRVLFESAQMLPALWLLNTIGRVYDELASLGQAFQPLDNYVELINSFLDAIADKDGQLAAARLSHYFEQNDARVRALLQAVGA